MAKLHWGETVWDEWSRERLLREIQRMYAAVVSARGALVLCRHQTADSPFWRPPADRRHAGTGGSALAKCERVLASYTTDDTDEPMYDQFFRFAVDLLFGPEFGFGWLACDACEHLYGSNEQSGVQIGDPCAMCAARGIESRVSRPITWDDLARRAGS